MTSHRSSPLTASAAAVPPWFRQARSSSPPLVLSTSSPTSSRFAPTTCPSPESTVVVFLELGRHLHRSASTPSGRSKPSHSLRTLPTHPPRPGEPPHTLSLTRVSPHRRIPPPPSRLCLLGSPPFVAVPRLPGGRRHSGWVRQALPHLLVASARREMAVASRSSAGRASASPSPVPVGEEEGEWEEGVDLAHGPCGPMFRRVGVDPACSAG